MNIQKHVILRSLAAVVFGGTMLGSGTAVAQQKDSSGVEILTRGPVHEAFAATVSYNPEPGILVKTQPPAAIEEVPPEQRLEGKNVAWIPGYWAWDEDQGDFLWISGIWRNLPPGRQWVPGYWAETDAQYQWTSGYWEDAATTEVSYLPEPPRSLEVGPNIVAPSKHHSWIPGNWSWRDDRYAWRSGYWVPVRENWIWTPAYYRWTRRGCVYVDGYWDYAVPRRGILFAPVHFRRAVYLEPDYYYSPATVISVNVFVNHLFLRPSYGHYYFGDYYEPRYRDRGFFASFSYNSGRRGYDPICEYERWEHRDDRNWENGRREEFEYRRDHEDARPPRTWAALSSRPESDRGRGGNFDMAEPLDRFVSKKDGGGRQRFQTVDKQERDQLVSQRQEIRKFGQERQQLETRGEPPAAAGAPDRMQAARTKVNPSPVVAKQSDRPGKGEAPPARLEARSSEQGQRTGKAGNTGTGPQSDSQDPSKPRRNQDGTANRDGGSLSTETVEPAPERRVKPGEKREAQPNPERRVTPGEKREAQPNPERRVTPGEKREAQPNPERRVTPGEKREVQPNPERRVTPGERREAQPNPERRVTPGEKREAQPNPEQKVNPDRKPKPDENRDAVAVPARKVEREQAQPVQPQKERQRVQSEPQQVQRERQRVQPEPQQVQRERQRVQPEPRQVQREPQRVQPEPQRVQPQQAAPRQDKAQPAAPKDGETDPGKRKKHQTE